MEDPPANHSAPAVIPHVRRISPRLRAHDQHLDDGDGDGQWAGHRPHQGRSRYIGRRISS